jgi:acylphosphatase
LTGAQKILNVMKRAVHLIISGIVQGVFFRQSTQQKAHELSICGWVRNCEDGTVEIEAEGEEDLLRVFMQWCHRGPQRAAVKNVEVKESVVKGSVGFEIKR